MNHKYKPADELLKKRQGVLFQKRKRKRRIIFSTVLIGILLLISFMKLESDRERQKRNGTYVSSEDPYYKVVVEDDDITVYKQDELYLKGSYQKQSNKYMILDENGTVYQDYYFKYTGETMMLYVRENDIYMIVYILNKEK